jgi:hypothetical protein
VIQFLEEQVAFFDKMREEGVYYDDYSKLMDQSPASLHPTLNVPFFLGLA